MRHVFRATKIGWDKKMEGVWFDADAYTKEAAEAEFRPFEDVTRRGYSYKGYEFDGQQYRDFTYLGMYEDDDMPRNTTEYIEKLHR